MGKGFDPLGLSDWVPVEWLRESELKHGRVCMLAVVGFVATDLGFRLPGEMHQVASINAHDMAVDMGAMTQIGIWIAVAECIGYLAILEMLDGSSASRGTSASTRSRSAARTTRDAAQGARERPAGHARL